MFRRPEISTRHLRIALFEIFVGLLHLACAINLESPSHCPLACKPSNKISSQDSLV